MRLKNSKFLFVRFYSKSNRAGNRLEIEKFKEYNRMNVGKNVAARLNRTKSALSYKTGVIGRMLLLVNAIAYHLFGTNVGMRVEQLDVPFLAITAIHLRHTIYRNVKFFLSVLQLHLYILSEERK